MNTEVTFLDHPRDWVCESDIIRASGSAIVAADTAVGINQHNAIFFPLVGSSHRANCITDGTITMVA
jgi:hypothetical protein